MVPKNGRPSCPVPGYWVSRRLAFYGPFSTTELAQDKLAELRLRDGFRYTLTGRVIHIDQQKASTLGAR